MATAYSPAIRSLIVSPVCRVEVAVVLDVAQKLQLLPPSEFTRQFQHRWHFALTNASRIASVLSFAS